MTRTALAERVAVLRDEVLDTAHLADREPPGAEVFEAVVRHLASADEGHAAIDQALQEAISRRLAWGDSEPAVLADIEAVCKRLLLAAKRSFRNASENITVIQVTTQVGCGASRMVAIAALGRAGRERAANMREELAKNRLRHALERQQDELARLRETLGE